MKKLLACGCLSVLALGAASQAQAETILKYGVSNIPGGLQYMTGEEYTKIANAKLPKDYRVEFYGSSQLGDDKELMQKLKLGTVTFSMPSSIMTSIVPQTAIFDMPFLVADRKHLKKIEKEIVWPKFAPLFEAKGYKLLGFVENGWRQITNNIKPINTPEDLKGLKIRVPSGVWRMKMFQAWKAAPTPMGFSEVFVALQTNTIDGQENPLSNIDGAKFQEVQKYLSITNHVYSPSFIVSGTAAFAKLPAEVRKVLEQAGRDVQAFAYANGDKMDNDLLGKLKGAGMQVNTANRTAFVAASKPIYDAFAKEVEGGQELIDLALKLAE
jgi:tripartite ATP-independent transporter DctP family solute receptor